MKEILEREIDDTVIRIEISRKVKHSQEENKKAEVHVNPKEKKISQTTIRCDVDVSDSVNGLAALLGFNTANDFLSYISTKLVDGLNEKQRNEYELIKKVSSRKRKINK